MKNSKKIKFSLHFLIKSSRSRLSKFWMVQIKSQTPYLFPYHLKISLQSWVSHDSLKKMFHCSHLSKQLVPSKHSLTTCRKVKIKPVKRLFSILKVVVQNKIKIQDHVKVETQFIITKVPLIALLSYCNKINATLFS